ncbi:PPHLN protein, partial [Atractosteus spatula]|nr:PPHLN protein [Atractosteus spatula]
QVYRQDCDTFGIVAKMLIAKDPSLEQSIQSSLQANLKEIGQRCVEAMQNFIDEYDSKYPSPCIPPQC